MKPEEFIAELKRYETELAAILSRFKETRDGIHIAHGDDSLLRRYVRELADLFGDVLGDNDYSGQIASEFNAGISNYLSSPSYKSVEDILATVRAALTRFTRNPQLAVKRVSIKGIAQGNKIFIGHGHSPAWRELKDFIVERLNLAYDEFNAAPVAGVTNIARLSQMLNDAAFAVLVLTAEDEHVDGTLQARMNVIHEVGLFQGRLGFNKAIVLLEAAARNFPTSLDLAILDFQ